MSQTLIIPTVDLVRGAIADVWSWGNASKNVRSSPVLTVAMPGEARP